MVKRKYKYTKRPRYYKKKGVKKSRTSYIAKIAKSVMNRRVETKMNQYTSGQVNIYQTITNTEVQTLYPAITQGTGQADRIGNKIAPTRLVLRMNIFCNNMNGVLAGASSSYFDIYIFKYKPSNTYYAKPTATDMAKFLQDDNTTNSYNGEILDGIRPINSDIFQLCYKKRIMLNNIYNTSVVNMTGYYQNASPQRTITIDLTKHMKKHWIFDDANADCTNDNLYIAIGSTQTNGDSLGATVIGTYRYITDFRFKDS